MPISKNNLRQICRAYLEILRDTREEPQATVELSHRTALDNFLKQTALVLERPVTILGEPKKIEVGQPDFIVTHEHVPIGYVEAEGINANLDNLKGHAKSQNKGFRENLDNFLLTNHLDFQLYVGGEKVDSVSLVCPSKKGSIKISNNNIEALRNLFDRFYRADPLPINNAHDLALYLARRTRQMRNEVYSVLKVNDDIKGDIHDWFHAFEKTIIHDITEEQFSDMYAQTLTYGLFAARCAAPNKPKFSREEADKILPKTNPFLRKFFHYISYDLDTRVSWIVDEIAGLLNQIDIKIILSGFAQSGAEKDPVVHFYETFLESYDPKTRELLGVYYTPEPVVSYIVRSLDYLLRNSFNMKLGLADDKALILDPATGTATFLANVVQCIYSTICAAYGEGAWPDYTEKRLLHRIFGFELLVAPYIIAHLKIGFVFEKLKADLPSDQRFGIYLTNTLDEAITEIESIPGFREITEEANEAVRIKREKPILVILGNPPYSGNSANKSVRLFNPPKTITQRVTRHRKGKVIKSEIKRKISKEKTFIGKLIDDYKLVNGELLHEKNPKMLQDDYVKFIRFAQWRVDETGEGLIGFITNHSYLDNPTFRGMRWHLINSFNEIYVLDLHGNKKKKERAPDGSEDHNVFDITQGVAIVFFLKEINNSKPAIVYHADLYGHRAIYKDDNDNAELIGGKYRWLNDHDIETTKWAKLDPIKPYYFFVPQNTRYLFEYENGIKYDDIFNVLSNGFKTHRDHFTIAHNREELEERVSSIIDNTDDIEIFKKKYNLKDHGSWKLENARQELETLSDRYEPLERCLYRPFDIRWIYYHTSIVDRPRYEKMRHMLHPNLGISVGRQGQAVGQELWNLVFCGNLIADTNLFYRGGIQYAPLFIYSEEDEFNFEDQSLPNFSREFLNKLAKRLNLPQDSSNSLPDGITAYEIFYYIYSILHSLEFRKRYAEFLKRDYPRIPLTSNLDIFQNLAELGEELVALHLLDSNAAQVLQVPRNPFSVKGNNIVENISYDHSNERIYINKTQYFDTVSKEVWNFKIGGYQVCKKWLKDRKVYQLTINEIIHYQRILLSVEESRRIMVAIDEAIPCWPLP